MITERGRVQIQTQRHFLGLLEPGVVFHRKPCGANRARAQHVRVHPIEGCYGQVLVEHVLIQKKAFVLAVRMGQGLGPGRD